MQSMTISQPEPLIAVRRMRASVQPAACAFPLEGTVNVSTQIIDP